MPFNILESCHFINYLYMCNIISFRACTPQKCTSITGNVSYEREYRAICFI